MTNERVEKIRRFHQDWHAKQVVSFESTCEACYLLTVLAQAEREGQRLSDVATFQLDRAEKLQAEVERLKGELCKVTQVSGGPTTPDAIDAGPYDTVDKLWALLNQAEVDLARVRGALEKTVKWFEQIHQERYERSGAMNATRLSERDLGRKILADARAALEGR